MEAAVPAVESTRGEQEDTFIPFTKAERMQQLADVEQRILDLLQNVGSTVQSLGKDYKVSTPSTLHSETSAPEDSGPNPLFCSSMTEFFKSLHDVDVLMKCQIWGLEETGIIAVSGRSEEGETTTTAGMGIHPDGAGKVGGFSVGWLNSRSNKVERDLEMELWERMEGLLRARLERQVRLRTDGAVGEDVKMGL